MKHHVSLDEILALAALEERSWPSRLDALRASGLPLMEAGGAATATDGAAAGGGDGTEAGGGMSDEINSRFDAMERSIGDTVARSVDGLVSRFESVFGDGAGDGAIDANDPLAAFLAEQQQAQQQADPLAALLGEPQPQQQQAADQFAPVLRAMAERTQASEQQVQQLVQQVQYMQLAQSAADLEARYPELADRGAADAAIAAATEWARGLGMEQLGHHPQVVELVYRASRADAAASGEVPAGADGHVGLESGSGAAVLQTPQDVANGIVGSGRGNSFWTG